MEDSGKAFHTLIQINTRTSTENKRSKVGVFWSLCLFFVFDEGGKTIVQLEEEKEILLSSFVHPLV